MSEVRSVLGRLWEQADTDGIPVVLHPLDPATGGGACVWVRGRPVIYLDPRLDGRRQAEVLAHELAHARRGHRPRPDVAAWATVAAREEHACDRAAAALLVDPVTLSKLADEVAAAGEGLGPYEVMGAFDVSWQVACATLDAMNNWEKKEHRAA